MQKVYKVKAFIWSWSKLETSKHKVLEKGIFHLFLSFPLDHEIAESQNHKITKWLRLAGTSGDHPVQPHS